MNKHYVFMRDIVVRHHPSFVRSADLRDFGLKQPILFNIERLVEESMAAVGGYDFVDESTRDFNDQWNSDSKTASLYHDGSGKKAQISGVENKIGSLRCVIYNPYKDRADYIFYPKDIVSLFKEPGYGKAQFIEKIRVTWTEKRDSYNSSEHYRVGDFATLARTGDDCF